MKRAVLSAAVVALVTIGAARPASADPARPSNVASEVIAITPATPSVRAEVVGGNAFMRLRVAAGAAVVVLGYENEPYLRIDPDGTVEENLRSRATYLNRTLTGNVDIPADADPSAPPAWHAVGGGGTYAWHDHRVHWMASGLPPSAQDWHIPLTVNGAAVSIDGRYAPVTAPSPFGWWAVVIVVAVATIVSAWRHPPRAAIAVIVASIVGLPVAWAIGRLPASGVGGWTGAVLLGLAIVAGAVALRARNGAWLTGAGLAVLLWAGRRLSVLDHAVLVTDLPTWADRLAVALGCGAGVAAVVVGVQAVLGRVNPSAAPRPG